MKSKCLFTGIAVVALITAFAAGCASMGGMGGSTPVRTTEHKDWDSILAELYPDGLSLNVERFRSRWGAVVDGDTVQFDGTNYHDFVYVFPSNVTLSDYEALVLVMEIYDIHKPEDSNSPTKNVTFSFRKGPTEVQAAEDNYNMRKIKQFWAADDADMFQFLDHGILIAGISGEQYTNLINDPVHGGGINIQNSIWGPNGSHLNRTGYTMKMHSMMLLPKRDTSAFGARGREYILNPAAFARSGQWGSNNSVSDILFFNNNGSIVYNFPAGINISDYTTLLVEYCVLDSSDTGDMTVNFLANSHEGFMLGTRVMESEGGTLRVPLSGATTGFAVRNNLRRYTNSRNYVIKIDSLKLVNE